MILCIIVTIALGGILKSEVCDVSEQDLGTGTPIMKATCIILSIPIDLIILILALIGIVNQFFGERG